MSSKCNKKTVFSGDFVLLVYHFTNRSQGYPNYGAVNIEMEQKWYCMLLKSMNEKL